MGLWRRDRPRPTSCGAASASKSKSRLAGTAPHMRGALRVTKFVAPPAVGFGRVPVDYRLHLVINRPNRRWDDFPLADCILETPRHSRHLLQRRRRRRLGRGRCSGRVSFVRRSFT